MSPWATVQVDVASWAALNGKDAKKILRVALARMRDQGIKVQPGMVGVQQGVAGGWSMVAATVSLAGALLLAFQPPSLSGEEDPMDAAASALGVSRAWLEGLEDGASAGDVSDRWLSSTSRALYMEGFAEGIWLRRMGWVQR